MAELVGPAQPIQAQLEDLLIRNPSGPDFAQATVGYVHNCVSASVEKITQVLSSQYPLESEAGIKSIRAIATDPINPPSSKIEQEDDHLVLAMPGGKKIRAIKILESVFSAERRLGQFEYSIRLYRALEPRQAAERHPGFESRFRNFLQTSGLPVDSPPAQIMAVAYITQVAKISAVISAKSLLEKAKIFGGVMDPSQIKQYVSSVIPMIYETRRHREVVGIGQGAIKRIEETNGLTAEQTQLLLDLAFVKGTAFSYDEEFMKAFKPIMEFVGQGNWDEAFRHRDFLLKYLAHSFPQWRRIYFERQTGDRPLGNMRQVVQAVKNGEIVLAEDGVPFAFRELFGDRLSARVARAERADEVELLRHTTRLSNAILHLLAYSTDGMHYELGSVSATSGQTLSRVRMQDGKQICERYRKDTVRVVNFASILHSHIKNVAKWDLRHGKHKLADVVKALKTAYAAEKHAGPNITYSLSDYLNALFHTRDGGFGEDDPVREIIKKRIR